jgi:hypothetical protein
MFDNAAVSRVGLTAAWTSVDNITSAVAVVSSVFCARADTIASLF